MIPGMGAIFVGNCTYPPNLEAARFIVTDLAPEFLEAEPRLRIVVCGRGTERLRALAGPNTVLTGHVEDLSPLLYSASVGLAPLLVAGGTSAKIVDYLAHGLVVVASPEAARGFADHPNVIACERAGIAESVLSALKLRRDEQNGVETGYGPTEWGVAQRRAFEASVRAILESASMAK